MWEAIFIVIIKKPYKRTTNIYFGFLYVFYVNLYVCYPEVYYFVCTMTLASSRESVRSSILSSDVILLT